MNQQLSVFTIWLVTIVILSLCYYSWSNVNKLKVANIKYNLYIDKLRLTLGNIILDAQQCINYIITLIIVNRESVIEHAHNVLLSLSNSRIYKRFSIVIDRITKYFNN